MALEGIACGCLVIGSRGGGLKEAIGRCGLTFRNGDAGELAGLLAAALADPRRFAASLPGTVAEHLARHGSDRAMVRRLLCERWHVDEAAHRPAGGWRRERPLPAGGARRRRGRLVRPAVAAGRPGRHGPPHLRGGDPQVAPARRPGPGLFRQGRPAPRRLRRLFPQPRAAAAHAAAPILYAGLAVGVASGLLEVFNPTLPNLLVGVLGFKAYFLYVPLLFVVPAAFPDDAALVRFLQRYVLIAFPVGLLSVAQFFSPAGSVLNTYAQPTDISSISTFGSSTFVRATGTFSYISGYTSYLLATTILILMHPHRHALALPGEPGRSTPPWA